MEYQEIEEILNRYLEGESTLEEENMLKAYFSQAELPENQREMKELFGYLNNARTESAPGFDVSATLNSLIEKEWQKETRNRFIRIITWVASSAAVLVLSFGIFQYLNKPEPLIKDTYNDPKLAYLETKRALLLVSRTLNHNTAKLQYLTKVDQSLNQVKKVAEIDKVINSVKK